MTQYGLCPLTMDSMSFEATKEGPESQTSIHSTNTEMLWCSKLMPGMKDKKERKTQSLP